MITITCVSSCLWHAAAIGTALLAVAYAYFKWNFQYWKRKNVPFLEPSIPFGNVQNPAVNTLSFGDQLAAIHKKARNNGWRHCGIFATTVPNYVPVDLELVKNILATDFRYFVDRKMYVNEKDDPISAHLFSIGGKKWRNLRTKLTPTFSSGKLKGMFQILVNSGLVLQKYLDDNIDTAEPVDVKDVLSRFSIDIIGSCAFGLDCNSFTEPDSAFRRHGRRVVSFTRLENMRLMVAFNFPKLGKLLRLRLFSKPIGDFYYKLAQDTVEYRTKNHVTRNDFMQLLIDMKSKETVGDDESGLSMDELAAQSFVFFFAGFETSSTTMTFTLFELALNPDIQDRVREEIRTVLARHDNKMTYDSLNELKYMKQVIDEALRKYPPLPWTSRTCVEDYKIPGEDVVIKKGTGVFISIKGIHYDKEIYENPEKFDPDRFTEERKRERSRYAHIPFGEGPRICIGERFGIMQTKVGLTSILQKFRVKLNMKTKLPLKMAARSFTETAEGDIWLDFEKV